MAWPANTDYNEALRNPHLCFQDPSLKGAIVETGPLGVPGARSGNFADVYRVVGVDGRSWAIKCFTREAPSLQDRYRPISHHTVKATLRGHNGEVRCVSFGSDTRTLVSGSDDRTIKLCNVEDTLGLATLNGHAGWVSCLSLSSNGQTLLSGSWDQAIKLWDIGDRP